jgi:hypothetical protein
MKRGIHDDGGAMQKLIANTSKERIGDAGALILIPGLFALLLTVGYHLVSLFVQLMAREYSVVVWHSHF